MLQKAFIDPIEIYRDPEEAVKHGAPLFENATGSELVKSWAMSSMHFYQIEAAATRYWFVLALHEVHKDYETQGTEALKEYKTLAQLLSSHAISK